ncbi:uncharacterized protein A4U43_C04F19710 [Asparagus officinalis]|uniref:Uncharacterized protein n=1 Tax=Asparagus officinalis TaxID=4686 RepID=A0A5P1F2T2_ASPOF|nr:uncharacterized protein A4U43_C04F19710 [Asparagus officinalis]
MTTTMGRTMRRLWAKSQRTTKKPKFLESPFQTEIPKKKRKWKKGVVVVKDDDDKGEKDEEKLLASKDDGMRTFVPELRRRENPKRKKIIGMLNMSIPSSQDFDIRLPGTVKGFYHNFTVQDVLDVSDDENKWLQHFLTLKVDKRRSIYEAKDQTISRYDMLHLLRGGRLADEDGEWIRPGGEWIRPGVDIQSIRI